MDRPQPSRRAGQEHLGAHHHQRDAEIQARQPRADQTHVVIQRQPTDERVRPRHRRGLAHRPDIGQQVLVGERHPFGLTGAARGVLHQRKVDRPGSGQRAAGSGHQGFGDRDVAQALDIGAQQVAERDGLGHGDQQRGPGIGQDAGVATQVIRQLGRPRRRVDGDGHGTGEEHAGEGDEVRPAGGQHDGDRVAGHDVAFQQPRRHAGRLPVQRRIGDVIAGARLIEDADVRALGGRAHVPVEGLGQTRRGRRCPAARRRGRR